MRPGGYLVRSLVAQTPHSRLYRADAPDGRAVALKELTFSLVPGATEVDAFEREAGLLRELDHPRIPRFIASFQEGRGVGTRLYLAQEFVDGDSLADVLKRRKFTETESKDVARQVLRILVDLHGRVPTLIHRDVKPANVIRRPDGSLVLVDFGAARTLANESTHRATLVGTYGYMPPEQLGGTVDATSDLYALGATLVHLVSGKSPADLASHDLALDVPSVVKASPDFVAWLSKMVARKRADRFPSASEALDALDRSPVVPARVTRARTSPGPFIALGLGIVVTLGVVVAALSSLDLTPSFDMKVEGSVGPVTFSTDDRKPPEPPVAEPPVAEPPVAEPPVAEAPPLRALVVPADAPSPHASDRRAVDSVRGATRVMAPGARRAFFVDAPIRVAVGLTLEVAPEAACTHGPTVSLDRFEIAPDERGRARWTLSGDVSGADGKCPEVRSSVESASSISGPSPRALRNGPFDVVFSVSPTVSSVNWLLGPGKRAVGLRLDAEARTATRLHLAE